MFRVSECAWAVGMFSGGFMELSFISSATLTFSQGMCFCRCSCVAAIFD